MMLKVPRILAIRRVNSSEAFGAASVRVCRVTGLPLWGRVVNIFISVAMRVATFTNGWNSNSSICCCIGLVMLLSFPEAS